MWTTVLFDLDGTLTDPKVGITKAVAIALEHFGIREEPENLTHFIGPPLDESFPEFYGFDARQVEIATEKFREYYVRQGWLENVPYPGIAKLLQDLKASGKLLMVATSKPKVTAVRILEHFGMAGYFDRIFGAPLDNQEGARKVNVIRNALSWANSAWDGWDYSGAVMVGDRRHDVIGAHQAGLPCIGVLYGYGGRAEHENAGADFIAEDLAGLRKLLLFETEIAEGYLAAFGRGWNLEAIRRGGYRDCLWPPSPMDGSPVLEGKEARAAFDALDYDTAYIFRTGVSGAGITGKVTAGQLDQERGVDVYVVDKTFRWAYIHTHEDGWMGPYFCRNQPIQYGGTYGKYLSTDR